MALVAKHWMRLVAGGGRGVTAVSSPFLHRLSPARFYHAPVYEVKVGIPEFLKAVGNGVESHIAKLETEIGDIQKLLVTRTLCLKKLGIPCKHVRLGWAWILEAPNSHCCFLRRPSAYRKKVAMSSYAQRKLILRYTHKYRLGLWRPRADVLKQ